MGAAVGLLLRQPPGRAPRPVGAPALHVVGEGIAHQGDNIDRLCYVAAQAVHALVIPYIHSVTTVVRLQDRVVIMVAGDGGVAGAEYQGVGAVYAGGVISIDIVTAEIRPGVLGPAQVGPMQGGIAHPCKGYIIGSLGDSDVINIPAITGVVRDTEPDPDIGQSGIPRQVHLALHPVGLFIIITGQLGICPATTGVTRYLHIATVIIDIVMMPESKLWLGGIAQVYGRGQGQ
ncbi:hypothetical protein ES703_70735 [subsurface metagenome]